MRTRAFPSCVDDVRRRQLVPEQARLLRRAVNRPTVIVTVVVQGCQQLALDERSRKLQLPGPVRAELCRLDLLSQRRHLRAKVTRVERT